MKIVHLGKYYAPARGGIETHVQQLARGQAALGHDVTVVAINHRTFSGLEVTRQSFAQTPTRLERDGEVRVIRVGRVSSLFKLDITLNLRRVLRRLARAKRVWHLHTPNPAMLVGLSGVAAVKPLFITHHSDIIQQRWGRLAL